MNWDHFATLAVWVGSIIAFAWGIYKYADAREQANKEPFLKEQLSLCFRASDVASRLTTESDPTKWNEARLEFWRLYYGPLCIVEDEAVEEAMVLLGYRIPKPEQPIPDRLPIEDNGFRKASLTLAHAARKLILDAWDIEIGSLKGLAAK
jgi:hypothetical protein